MPEQIYCPEFIKCEDQESLRCCRFGFGRAVTRIACRHIGKRRNVDLAALSNAQSLSVLEKLCASSPVERWNPRRRRWFSLHSPSPGTVALQELASDGMAIAVTPGRNVYASL